MIAETLKAVYLSTAVIMAFVSWSLWQIQGKIDKQQILILTIFWLLISTPLLEYIGIALNGVPHAVVAFNHSSILLVGPAVYFYWRVRMHQPLHSSLILLHIFPFVIFFTVRIAIEEYIPLPLALVYLLHIACYQIIIVRGFVSNRVSIKDHYPSKPLMNTSTLLGFYLIVSVAYFSQIVLYAIGSEVLRLVWDLSNTLTFVYVLLLSKGYVEVLRENNIGKPRALELTDDIAKYQIQTLNRLFKNEQLHLDNELSLKCLANRLELTPNQTSELLNTHLKTSFYGLVNQFRLESAVKLLTSSEHKIPISDLYLSAGFNNKNTFYREFKKAYGMPPGEFRSHFLSQKRA